MTTVAWLEEFIQELTSIATAPKGSAAPLPRTSWKSRDIAMRIAYWTPRGFNRTFWQLGDGAAGGSEVTTIRSGA